MNRTLAKTPNASAPIFAGVCEANSKLKTAIGNQATGTSL